MESPRHSDDIGQVFAAISKNQIIEPKDRDIERLQYELQSEKDGRKEERFVFILLLVIIFDTWTFSTFETWSAPLAIFLLQAIFLIVLAKRLGVDEAHVLLDRVLHMVSNTTQKGE